MSNNLWIKCHVNLNFCKGYILFLRDLSFELQCSNLNKKN